MIGQKLETNTSNIGNMHNNMDGSKEDMTDWIGMKHGFETDMNPGHTM